MSTFLILSAISDEAISSSRHSDYSITIDLVHGFNSIMPQ